VLQAREDALHRVVDEAKAKLATISSDKKLYKALLVDLLAQAGAPFLNLLQFRKEAVRHVQPAIYAACAMVFLWRIASSGAGLITQFFGVRQLATGFWWLVEVGAVDWLGAPCWPAQALDKLGEPKAIVQARQVDIQLVNDSLEAAKAKYTKVYGKEPPEVTVDTKNFLPPPPTAGSELESRWVFCQRPCLPLHEPARACLARNRACCDRVQVPWILDTTPSFGASLLHGVAIV
jgi:ATP synthase (E/31 kDa) subunit